MAYTATIDKLDVNRIDSNIFQASIRLTVSDGATTVFESTASAKYNSASPNLTAVKNELINNLQDEWDKFVLENGIFNSSVFDTMVSEIQALTNTYINQ